MKKIVLAALLAYPGASQAAYKCVSYDKLTQITVNIKSTGLGNDLILKITNPNGEETVYGTLHEGPTDTFLQKKVIVLYGEGKFTIVSKPINCGRGDCTLGTAYLTGKLELGGAETFFTCENSQ
ncbi:MAG: hypothetical protein AB7H97_11565 [Pseudobdellovibrionaceae bacterium]